MRVAVIWTVPIQFKSFAEIQRATAESVVPALRENGHKHCCVRVIKDCSLHLSNSCHSIRKAAPPEWSLTWRTEVRASGVAARFQRCLRWPVFRTPERALRGCARARQGHH